MTKQNVIVFFGGKSPEHEVSIITGLQVVENIDKNKYEAHAVYVDKKGLMQYLNGLSSRKEFFSAKRHTCSLVKDVDATFLETKGSRFGSRRIKADIAYLAFHGEYGEGGKFQGMLETLSVPYTSSNVESSIITMSKSLTKMVLLENSLPSVEGISFMSESIRGDVESTANEINSKLQLPVIIKPTHFGSSIGINIARTDVELEKHLLAAAMIDTEVLVEKVIKNFSEYNVSVRSINGQVEASEVEKPLSQDEILSFADKYQRGGGKKSGGDGMASLQRELPAKIDRSLKDKLQSTAIAAFKALKCSGLVRIDFMVVNDAEVYITEVNSIPGSMSYYLWEASGISFTEQITDLLEQAKRDFAHRDSKTLDYSTDIVSKFVAS